MAIPKYTNPDGDIWTGSVVVDKENTAGFGKNALVAIVTQPSAKDKKQEQYLWYSTDKGKSFKFYSGNPVMPNPGTDDFRDHTQCDRFSSSSVVVVAIALSMIGQPILCC